MPAAALVRVPVIAFVTCIIANPYYVLDWQAVVTERVAQAGWFEPALTVHALLSFARNSILSGFGIALSLMYVAVLIRHLMRPAPMGVRLLGFGILIPIVVMAAITVKQSTWHSSFRYIPYVLPAMIVFLAVGPLRHRETIFATIAAATVLQAVPLKLAYFDENSATHSTRLASAAWIDAHVPPHEAICVSTPTMAPYNVPPFRFDRRRINSPDCHWRVQVEGQYGGVAGRQRLECRPPLPAAPVADGFSAGVGTHQSADHHLSEARHLAVGQRQDVASAASARTISSTMSVTRRVSDQRG